jgi:hypothetical protein
MINQKSDIERFNQMAAVSVEKNLGDKLESMGYEVRYPVASKHGYDLVAIKCNKRYFIQVESDLNNAGYFQPPSKRQKGTLMELSNGLGYIPVIAYYSVYTDVYFAKNVNSGKNIIF